MTLAFIGIGNVGFALANRLQHLGHQIIIAHQDGNSDSVREALAQNPDWPVQPLQMAIDSADVVFLATPFKVVTELLSGLQFKGKTLVDCTNPVGPGVSHGLKSERSGSELIQELAPDAQVVKAYTIYGYENLANSSFPEYTIKPAMFICGNDADSKAQITQLNTELGFETLDTGALSQALHLEHMTLLWVKMVRMGGRKPRMVWGVLKER
jgi:hypothetical protein